MNNPSKDQILTALEKAHLAGDVEAAKEFASWHNELYGEQPEPEKPGIIDRVSNAFSFGGDDEPEDVEVDGFTGAAQKDPGPQLIPYEPSLWEKIKGLIPANKDAAWVEYQARKIAEEEGVSVDEVYKSVGGSRPIFNPEGRPTIQALAEATEITVKELPDLIPGAANTIMRSIRGGDESADDSWLDRAIEYTEPEPPENPDPNYDAFYGIGKSLGYSTSTMVSAITAGALTGLVTKNPIATGVAAGTTAGTVAYRGSRDEFLSRVKEGLDARSEELYGRKLNQEEWDKAYKEFDEAATKYGAWEAIPEAVSNLVFLRAFSAPLKGMGKKKLKEVTKRAASILGTENVTETTTAVGQNRAEVEAGLTDEELSVGDAFRKQVIPTTIITGLMGGAGAGGKSAYEFSKSKERKLGEAMQREVESAELPTRQQDVAQTFNPSGAQVERKPMTQLVSEKLEAMGVSRQSVETQVVQEAKEELLPVAGNKLTRGEIKSLEASKRDLEQKLDSVEAPTSEDVQFLLTKIKETGSNLSAREQKRQAVNMAQQQYQDYQQSLQDQLDIVNTRLSESAKASAAEADLSRIDQGIIPDRFQRTINDVLLEQQNNKEAKSNEEKQRQERQKKKSATSAPQKYGEGKKRIEYAVKGQPVLTGVLDKEITLEDAQLVDPSAFELDDGIFIRDSKINEYNQSLGVSGESDANVDQISDDQQGDNREGSARPKQSHSQKRPTKRVGSSTRKSGKRSSESLSMADPAARDDEPLSTDRPWLESLIQSGDTDAKLEYRSVKKAVDSVSKEESEKGIDAATRKARSIIAKSSLSKQAKKDLFSDVSSNAKQAAKEAKEKAESDTLYSLGADKPADNWYPTYRSLGTPGRPESGKFSLAGKMIELKPEDKPTRREGIRVMVEDLIGPRLYQGKVRGKSTLGFYKRNNSEVRVSNYDDVEVMAHELAHYLDFHYRFNNRFTKAYEKGQFKEEVAGLSYTTAKKLKYKEGFAEFVRLWLTNYDQAKSRAPSFTKEFERLLSEDKALNKKLTRMREEMHRWYMQGPRAQLRAKSGKDLSQAEQITQYMQSYPAERYRQETIDKIHAAKVVERTLSGGLQDASISPYKQFQLINGAESLHESILKDGTPSLSADGSSYEVSGKGLNEVFKPVSKHGWKRFDLLMDYFKARRANELMKQGRERLFTKQEISAGLELAEQYPEFKAVFEDYQAFNKRMMDFYVDMGLIDSKQRKAFSDANRNYVPFHRVIEQLEDGQEGGNASKIGARLTGGTQNVRDIAENIVEGLYSNVRAALIARAKQTLFKDIQSSQDGSLFAAKLSPDSKKVGVELSQMSMKIAEAMASVGLTVSKDGMILAGDIENQVTDVNDIAEALKSNPDLLSFLTFGHKPNTAETYVDSVIIDGKRTWFEVRNPLLVDMLTGMRGFRSGALLNAMFRVKNLQTRTVTAMLQFLGPNAIRDTLSAFVISKNRFIPVLDTLKGMGDVIFETDLYKEFRRQGGGYGTRIEARTEETRKRRQLDLPSRNLWDTAAKLLAGYDRFASAFEYGSRLGDYRRGRKAGKTPLEAAWEAREVATDFSKMGRNELWAKFLRTVPFMNAGIQGLDKTAREIFEMQGEIKGSNLTKLNDSKLRFLAAGGAITLGTVLLWLINNDDERYKALTPDQKARFWWIFIPGLEKPFKIPRPYDIGHLFATIPEVSLDYIKDRDGEEAVNTMAWTLVNTLGIGDYPGVFQPLIEVSKNKKFTGAPVVPYHLVNVPAEYQFTDRTPQIYRNLGMKLKVSPLVAEHYTKGYLRYVEAYIADASEAMLWNDEQWGERPFSDKGPIDYLTYQFRGQRVPYRTKWTEGYFKLKKKAAGIKSAFDLLAAQAIRDDQPVMDFSKDKVNQLLINMDAAFSKIDRAFSDQDAVLATIKYDKDLSKEEKERRIEDWYEQKNKALAKFYEQANKALKQAENEISGG